MEEIKEESKEELDNTSSSSEGKIEGNEVTKLIEKDPYREQQTRMTYIEMIDKPNEDEPSA